MRWSNQRPGEGEGGGRGLMSAGAPNSSELNLPVRDAPVPSFTPMGNNHTHTRDTAEDKSGPSASGSPPLSHTPSAYFSPNASPLPAPRPPRSSAPPSHPQPSRSPLPRSAQRSIMPQSALSLTPSTHNFAN